MLRNKSEAEARAISFLERSISALDSKLAGDRDWRRCKRVIQKMMPHFHYPWMWLPLLPYSEYLKTEHWERLRREALEKANGKCQVCNGGGELHTHHRTYENLGNEKMNDLIILCERCHSLFHEQCKLAEQED